MLIDGKIKYQYNEKTNAVTMVLEPQAQQPVRKYFSPIGTDAERQTNKIWPGNWIDANGYCRWYYTGTHYAWHTGADLNLNLPSYDRDAHAPIQSIADGKVYAIRQFSGWDWIICIEHKDVLSRYAHVENIQVTEGQEVIAGQYIANIGNAGGSYPYHLHFDIAKLDARMREVPGDWPRDNKARVLNEYLDPKSFLLQQV